MRRSRLRAVVVGLGAATIALVFASAAQASDFPDPSGYFVDSVGAIPAADGQALEDELAAYAARSGHQLAVAVVASTGGQSIEDYANDLFGDWGVGSAARDDGVLIVVAIDDRRLRIEVGRGLEGTLTDIEAADIIRDDMVPRLKSGDYAGAIRSGERAVRAALGDPTPNAGGGASAGQFAGFEGGQPGSAASSTARSTPGLVVALIFVFLFLSIIGRAFGRRRRGGFFPIFLGNGWGGGGFSGGGGGGFGGGFGGFGGGSSGGGGASGSW